MRERAILNNVAKAIECKNKRLSADVGLPHVRRWRGIALAVLSYVIFLRFVFLGTLNLLPEEAYYWNYAQHLDIGYLDHPPMVAWMIWVADKARRKH